MKNICCLIFILVLPFAFSSCANRDPPTSERPNIILIMSDDHGAEDFSCYNSSTPFKSPNIKELAESGVQFRICYTTNLCGPTRAMIMSGKHPQKSCHWCNWGVFNKDHKDFPYDLVNDVTFYRTLSEAGYITCLAGKWDGYKGLMPKYFDASCIWPREVRWIPESANYTGHTKTDDPLWQPTATFWHPFIMQNGEFLETTDDDFSEDIFSDFIIDFVRENKDSGRPFFVYYPMILPTGLLPLQEE